MKKLVLILLVCLLLYGVTQPVTAQGSVIYLPIIVKGNGTMATWAKLEISDGTTTVNLISSGDTGFHLKDWNPQVIQPKEGGVFQDSPIAPGRRLVYAVYATAIETMTIDVNDYDEDGLIEQAQDLMRLLNKARAYGGTTDYQDTPVYIRARSDCETNDRYAVIINWSIPELDNPYAPPFVVAGEIALMDDLTLQLERGHWTANAPGVGTCVQVSNQQVWQYNLTIDLEASSPPEVQVTEFAVHGGSGAIYAVSLENRIMKSTDDGDTWANNLTGAPLGATTDLTSIIALANNNLLAAGKEGVGSPLVRSTNDGVAWSDVSIASMNDIYALVQVPTSATVLAVGTGTAGASIWRSTDNGLNWTQVLSNAMVSGYFTSIGVANDGGIVAVGYNGISYRSVDDGQNWTYVNSGLIGNVQYPLKIFKASDDNLYSFGLKGSSGWPGGHLFKSVDNGLTWSIIYTNNTLWINNIIETSTSGEFYAIASTTGSLGQSAYLLRSGDYGQSWNIATHILTGVFSDSNVRFGLVLLSTNRLLLGIGDSSFGYIYRTGDENTTITMGQSATCENVVYVGNRNNIANLTHIFIDDGGVFTSIFPAVLPATLFPAVPAANDALYIGNQSSVAADGPFGGIVLDIGTPAAGLWTITPEYWNSLAWSTLTVRDNTFSFSRTGIGSIHWVQPSNWTETAVNGITGWWIRFRISAITGTVTPPTQQNRNIYAINSASVNIININGDIPAFSQFKLSNQSDRDGPGGSAPNLYSNRIIAGLRSNDRGIGFLAYINLSRTQPVSDILMLTDLSTSPFLDPSAPTGGNLTYQPIGAQAMETRVTVSFGPAATRDYFGTYHAFLRAQRTAGASTDLTVRLQVATGSGGITYTTTGQQLQTTTAFEVLDFGEITLPVSSSFKSTDLADTTEIRIQASAASGTPDLNLYDLILIPVDEWAVDAVDMANESDSDVGRSNGIAKLLDIDSVTDPRIDIKTLVRTADVSEFITAEYNPITGGGAILQANVDQRLWFFAMQTSATGATYYWLAPPEIAHTIQLYHNSRYLGLRGSR